MSPQESATHKKMISPNFVSGNPSREVTLPFEAHNSNNEKKTYNKQRDFRQLLQAYIPFDIVALLAGFVAAWGLSSFVNDVFFARPVLDLTSDFAKVRIAEFLLISCGAIMWFQHSGHYRMRMPFWMEAKSIFMTLAFAMMADGFMQFSSRQNFSRFCLMAGWMISGLLIVLMRSLLRSYLNRKGLWRVSVLLVGDGETAYNTRLAINSEPGFGYRVVAHVKNLPTAFMQAGRSWENMCRMHGADYIIIALDGKAMANAHQPLSQLMREDIPFSVSPALHNFPVAGITPQYFINHDVMLFARNNKLKQKIPSFLKRTSDIILSAAALIALSPLLLIIAICVRLDGGPALFGHPRLGRNGEKFNCLKFRSMVRNGNEVLENYLAQNPEAKEEWELTQKLKHDPRVTKIGSFLRRSSIDELPQLINVLKGDMSLVGPRPIVTAEVERYESDIAHYYRMRPGITGLWQVSGRNDVTYAQRVQMDSWYVRNWSLWHDIAIICKTLPALLNRSGAY